MDRDGIVSLGSGSGPHINGPGRPTSATRAAYTVLMAVGGRMLTPLDVEKLLLDIGAVKLGDQRLQKKEQGADENTSKIRQGKATGDDEDSDWD